MPYARDNLQILGGGLLVLLAIALLLFIPYALVTRGFSIPIQCVIGQETALRATFDVDVRDADIDDFEQALRAIADRRGMVFSSMSNAAFPSGRSRLSFEVCDQEAYLVAVRDEDADAYSIFVSQAVSAPPAKAVLVAQDIRKWLSERQAR